MKEFDGWLVASSFGDPADEAARTRESVGLAELSWTPKFNLQGRGLSAPLDFGPGVFWWPTARLQYLVTCEASAGQTEIERLQLMEFAKPDASLPALIYVTDVTSVYTHLLLAGPRSRDVLIKLSSLNLADEARGNLSCAQASVAHVHAMVLRKDLAEIRAYHLLVGREYGESVWHSVLRAGHEFHISPLGLEALQRLQG